MRFSFRGVFFLSPVLLALLSFSLTYGAVGPVTGCVDWSYEFPAPLYTTAAVSPTGTIYVPCENGRLYRLDPNGVFLGDFPSSGQASLSTPAVAPDGTVYVGNAAGIFWSVASDGQSNWSKALDGPISTAPVIADNAIIYVPTLNGTLYAWLPDGTLGWEYAIPHLDQTIESIIAPAAIGTDGSVYVTAMYSPTIYALDPNTGAERWQSDLTDYFNPDGSDSGRTHHGFVLSPVVAEDGTIYVIPTYSKTLFALDPADGQVIWQAELTKSDTADAIGLMVYYKLDAAICCWTIYESQSNFQSSMPQMSRANVTQGRIGNAMTFDGSTEYIKMPDYPGVTGTAGRTCCAWIRTTMDQTGVIASWGASVDGAKWMFRVEADGKVGVGVWGGYIKTSQAINDGQWHHVAAVLRDDGSPDVSEIQLFIDGNLDPAPFAGNSRPVQTADSEPVIIGARYDTAGNAYTNFFQGDLDEVRIYNRALTADEIRPLTMPEDYLVTRYGDAACWTAPVIGPDGTVYAAFDHPFLFAVNPDGSVKWCKRLGMTGGFTVAVDSQNKIYAASEDGTLYVLDADGQVLSVFKTDDILAHPVVLENGDILVSGQSGKLWQLTNQSCGQYCQLSRPADFNRDGQVNLVDFVSISQMWLTENDFFTLPENTFRLDRIDFDYPEPDVNRDFYIDWQDVLLMIEQWLLDSELSY